MRFAACISYDGSKFYGFQRLKKNKTVQEELEKALTKINKDTVEVKGAGRTDRGVHALEQIIHFDLTIEIDEAGLKRAINSVIDEAIYVKYCKKVDSDFHARFGAKEKSYTYAINLAEYDPINNDYLYNYNRKLNTGKMKKAAKYFKGLHSFKAFVTGKTLKADSTIFNVSFDHQYYGESLSVLYITFTGNTFYNHMVRNMVGALILVGEGKIKPKCIKEMLIKEENIYNYSTVPAAGLCLVKVKY